MAKIHILTGAADGLFRAIVHTETPPGKNDAGVAWSDALRNSGMAVTCMTVGTGPGQISEVESADIASGAIFESVVSWGNNPMWPEAQRNADLDLRANQAASEKAAELKAALRMFGASRG